MLRSTSLAVLTAVITLGLAAPQAEAGGRNFKSSAHKLSVQSPTFKSIKFKPPVISIPNSPPTFKPIKLKPPVFKPYPPVIKPCPPIIKPYPPIFKPICPPPVICPPKPPIICPPPIIKPICHKPVVPPVVCLPNCTCHKCTCNDWYFGMSLQIVQTSFGMGLQVHDVVPNSPAYLAGLEVGDILVMAAGQSFQTIRTNEEGVAMLQSLATATQANLNLVVQDSRSNQLASINITPQSKSAPAPVITTAMAF